MQIRYIKSPEADFSVASGRMIAVPPEFGNAHSTSLRWALTRLNTSESNEGEQKRFKAFAPFFPKIPKATFTPHRQRLAPTVFSLRAGEMLLLLLLNILAQRFWFVNNKLIDLQNRSEENSTPFLYQKVEIGKNILTGIKLVWYTQVKSNMHIIFHILLLQLLKINKINFINFRRQMMMKASNIWQIKNSF